jgi:putative glutamine amidotransferase
MRRNGEKMSRPKIALACGKEGHSMSLNKEYLDAIWRSGGLAVILPYTDDDAQIQEYTELFDGFMFCGGGDVDPKYYNEEKHPKTANISSERDRFESKLFRAALETNKPILGICRGEQFINVLLGGTLYQHIDDHTDNRGMARDGQSHSVALDRSGFLFSLIGKENVLVNTYHHQCVKALADVLVPDALSEDGYIEAYHLPSHPFCLGVQWHPELFYDKDESSVKIFTAFVDACR